MKPYPWQRQFFDLCKPIIDNPNNQVVTLKATRQLSKSFSASLLGIYALNHKYWRVGYLTPVFKQARKVFKVLQNLNSQYDLGLELTFNESRLEVHSVTTDSVLIFMSSNQGEDLRGETFHLLIIDEAAYVKDSVIDLLMPTRIVNHAPLIMVSTPLRKAGRFYEMFSDSSSVKVDWNDYDTSSVLTEDVLEYFRARLAPSIFKTDYLGEFLDSGTSLLFGNLQDAIIDTPPFTKLYIGIDCGFGSDKDFTSVVGLNEFGQEVFVEHLNQGGISAQEVAIYNILTNKDYSSKIQQINLESNSLGAPMLDHIKKMLVSNGFHTLASRLKADYWNSSTKASAFTDLIAGFGTGVVKVLNLPFHIEELSNYGMKVSSTGVVTYGNLTEKEADEEGLGTGGASHDDSVCALAHAYSAFKQGTTSGKYSLL